MSWCLIWRYLFPKKRIHLFGDISLISKAKKWNWKSPSCVQLFTTPQTIQIMEFSRPEYCSAWPFPSPQDLPNTNPSVSHIAGRFFTSWVTREAHSLLSHSCGKRFLLECCALLCFSCSSCLTSCTPMACSLPASSVHGDSPGKSTEGVCHALFQGIFPPRDQAQVFHIAGGFFTNWATREDE